MEKGSIMNYLPEQERIKLAQLIRKLGQETQQKLKYKALYEKTFDQFESLKSKYNKLEQQNLQLKAQISTSRLAISKAKQAFSASKSANKIKKTSQTSDDQFTQRKLQKQTQFKFEFETEQNGHLKNSQYSKEDNHEKFLISRPPKNQTISSARKHYQNYNEDYSNLNKSNSSRKQEIIGLRQEIKQLTNSIKKKKRSGLPLSQKLKIGQEIRERFQKSKQKKRQSSSSSSQEQSSTQMKITNHKSLKQIPHQKKQYEPSMIEDPNYAGNSMKASKISKKGKFSSQKFIIDRSDENQEKEDLHPNSNYHYVSNEESSKKENWGKSSIFCKKTAKDVNMYDESFFDLIKQLNGH